MSKLMRLSHTVRSLRLARASLVVAGALGLSLFAAQTGSPAATAQAASGLHYVRGYSVQGSWLCYGYSNGIYHCTQHWTRSGGRYISLNPSFVPSQAATTVTKTTSTTTQAAKSSKPATTVSQNTTGQLCHDTVKWPKTISQWTVPLGCYSKIYTPNPNNYPSRPSYGYCNWWPEVLHPSLSGSSALHMASHSTPRVGAVVWFSPGVQGASSDGHYAQVVAIAPGGKWVLVTEMNFYWRGGGFKKVDYRFIHTGSGVSFRY